ncbi:hypothetical protein BU17DRAFT_78950 [Hysterangium stoloniferum]|nr:hypothetical protein BU17DRAFT_78950 [Hysterangium stoloniferum]
MDIAAIVVKVAGDAVPLFSVREVGGRPFFEESSHPKDSGIWETMATWHPPSKQYPHFQPSTYTITYPFSPRPVPAPDSFSGPVLPRLTPPSPVRKPPPSQSSMLPRSQPFPPSRCQKAIFATREAVVVTPSFARRSFVIPSIDDFSVQSKVAATSDSGPAPSVE